MNKLYDKITWHNNDTPALNETNLNKMSKAIDDIDDRVVLVADDVFEKIPQIESYLEQADDLVEALETMTANPPYIGENGHWYVWNTSQEAYVDSGIDASITVQIADITMLAPDATPYVTNTGTDTDPIFHLFIPRGQKGEDGQDGADGADGADGVSPAVTITTITGGHNVNITDATHPSGQNFNVMDGADGQDGTDGQDGIDGVSPEVNISTITGGHRVNITDATHPQGQDFDVMDGATQDISGKADKVSNATNGNFAGLDSNGNLTDSGKKASDFLPSNTPIPDEVTANPQGTATGTLTKLGIGSDIYNIQGGGGGITKTINVYSAASDTVSFTDLTGSKTVTTNASGVGTVSINYISGMVITLTSSVAKNPNNLSENYSKAIQILEDTTAVYVMPNKDTLYWFGYKSSNLEDVSAANGWNLSAFDTPSYQTNKIVLTSTGSGRLSGVGTKNALSNNTKLCAIYKGITVVNNVYGVLEGCASKSFPFNTENMATFISNTLSYAEKITSLSYASVYSVLSRASELYAFWYENDTSDELNKKVNKTNIAPVESDMIASRSYSIGEQFYLPDGRLYKAKAPIANWATFTVGTNCELAGDITSQIPYTYAFNEYLQADQKLKLHVYSQRLTSDSSGFIILPSYIKPYLFVRAIVENDVNFCLARVTTDKQQVALRLFSPQMQPVTSAVTEVIRILYYTEE